MKTLLNEMATLRKAKTGLPVNIYVDDAGTYLNGGHFKRIKFQKDYGNTPVTREFATMTLEGELIQSTMSNCEVKTKDLNKIRNFVLNNKEALSHLADAEIDIFEFSEIMIPGGEKATLEQIKAQKTLLDELLDNLKPKNVDLGFNVK